MYKPALCYKCGTHIIVLPSDASRYYCSPCAMAKFSSEIPSDTQVGELDVWK